MATVCFFWMWFPPGLAVPHVKNQESSFSEVLPEGGEAGEHFLFREKVTHGVAATHDSVELFLGDVGTHVRNYELHSLAALLGPGDIYHLRSYVHLATS
jgi:hypothetical protein